MKTIIVTAADQHFAPLLQNLLDSIGQWSRPPADAIGLLDLGLGAETLAAIENQVDGVVIPGWDLPVPQRLRNAQPHLRALTARPFLPEYFPGYDRYLWLDCDTWVQGADAIPRLIRSAVDGRIAIVAEDHLCYSRDQRFENWRKTSMRQAFGDTSAQRVGQHDYYNAGVFCLQHDAAHWTAWRQAFVQALERATDKVSDQTALNFAIWHHSLPTAVLPARYNWCCHLALPTAARGADGRISLCEPVSPEHPLEIIHLTGKTKYYALKNTRLNVAGSLWFNGLATV